MGATKKLINFGVIGYVIGSLLLINGILMALPLGFSIYHSDGATNAFLFSSGLTLAIGFCLRYFLRRFKEAEIKRREGFMIVTFSWVAMTIFGTLPYILSNSIPDISNAFFETMSGFSTTGASILNNISERSLVLLDEIGRGTSTYDGISIAWAISEFLHEHPSKAKTLFATHYHELNEMTVNFDRIKNFNVSVKELKDSIVFLRKLVSGGSNHSFGIHVAKLAGMPNVVIHRANKILAKLEKNNKSSEIKEVLKQTQEEEMQLSFFQLDDPLLENIKEEILATNIDTLTPIEALMKLNEIKRMLTKK